MNVVAVAFLSRGELIVKYFNTEVNATTLRSISCHTSSPDTDLRSVTVKYELVTNSLLTPVHVRTEGLR